MPILVRGPSAVIRYGYHRAATLGAWSITNGRLTADVQSADAFRLTQSPLTLIVPRSGGTDWRWRLSDVERVGPQLIAAVHDEEGT